MDRWYSRYRRGDVWFLHFDEENGDGIRTSSVQKKSRPYLIVSCEENNLNAPIFNVVPITTRDSDHLPMHVYFRYMDGPDGGRNQIILCEQITTVSVEVFQSPRSRFMYSFTLELMNKVDTALARQLGLKPRVADMHVLECIVNELAEIEAKRIEAMKEKEVQMRVESLAAFLIKKFNLNLDTAALLNDTECKDTELQQTDQTATRTVRETVEDSSKSANPELVATRHTDEVQNSANKPKKRHKWSIEEKRQFLEDYKKLSISQMSEKYGIKKSSVSYNVCVFRKEVGADDFGATI